jgi:hypothetical protein
MPIFKNCFADLRGLILSNNTVGFDKSTILDNKMGLFWGLTADNKLRWLLGDTNKYECTANYVLDGRGLYLSKLGPQDPEKPDKRIIPVEYIVLVQQGETPDGLVRGVNKWQLGRLVDRFHLLGTVRLAALIYYSSLLKVGAALSRFDPRVKEAHKTLDSANDKNGEEVAKKVKEANAYFTDITKIFNEDTRSESGIMYRVERARYYIEQIRKNVDALQIKSLAGYQSYEKFVERCVGPAFDFINRLGVRYERAANSLSMLEQRSLSKKTTELAKDIQEIQRYGEIALLAALLPYYTISILSDVIEEAYVPYATIVIWTIFIGVAVYRGIGKGTEHRRLFTGATVGVVAALWAIAVYCGLLHWPESEQDKRARAENERVIIEDQHKTLQHIQQLQQSLNDNIKEQINVEKEQLKVQKEQAILPKAEPGTAGGVDHH